MLHIRLDQFREDGLFVHTRKTGKRLLFVWDENLRTAVTSVKALRHRVTSLYLLTLRVTALQCPKAALRATGARP